MTQLDAGSILPDIELKVGESEVVRLPQDIETDYSILLFYRGHW